MEHTYKPTKILSKSELSHKIAAIKRSKIDEMIHQAAISSLHHAKDSGDITFMTKLFEVMPKSSRRMGLKKWAMDNAPLTFDADKQTFGLKKKRSDGDWNLREADEKPFWKHSVEGALPQEVKVEDVEKYLDRLINGGTEKKPATAEVIELARYLKEKVKETKVA